jgi:hypothetical protein
VRGETVPGRTKVADSPQRRDLVSCAPVSRLYP